MGKGICEKETVVERYEEERYKRNWPAFVYIGIRSRDRDSSGETLVHASWTFDLLLINVIPNL